MSFSKQISLPGGSLSASESGGKVTLAISMAQGLGGGEASGVVQVSGSAQAVVSGKQAVDLAFAMLEAHLPAAAAMIAKEVQAFADAEMGSL